jgi:hypothetical protein
VGSTSVIFCGMVCFIQFVDVGVDVNRVTYFNLNFNRNFNFKIETRSVVKSLA